MAALPGDARDGPVGIRGVTLGSDESGDLVVLAPRRLLDQHCEVFSAAGRASVEFLNAVAFGLRGRVFHVHGSVITAGNAEEQLTTIPAIDFVYSFSHPSTSTKIESQIQSPVSRRSLPGL
jgi:hypothetical protein